MTWNKTKLINFFLKNFKKEIVLYGKENTLRIQGKLEYLDEMDLCIHKLFEVQLIESINKKLIYLTLHDDFVGILFNSFKNETDDNNKIKSETIKYINLKVFLQKNYE